MSTATTPPTADNAVEFDFRKPCGLPHEVEQQLRAWQETACRIANDRWQLLLPSAITWTLDTIQPHRPAKLAFDEAVVAFEVAVNQQGYALLTVPRSVAVTLVHAMLGLEVAELVNDKGLSPLDVTVLEYYLTAFVDGCNETRPSTPACELGRFHAKPDFQRLFRGHGDVAVVSYQLEGPFGAHALHWIWPDERLTELFASPLTTAQSEEAAGHLQAAAREIPFEVVVRLGSTRLQISELGQLAAGDVILLDQRVSDELRAFIGSHNSFAGWAGKIGNRQGFQINRVLAD